MLDLLEAASSAAQALPTNPTAHAELLNRVKDAATEKATPVGPIGLTGLFPSTESNSDPAFAVKANWMDASTLSMAARTVADGVGSTYTLRFGGDQVDINYQDNSGFVVQLRGTAKP